MYTTIDEIAPDIFRLSTLVPEVAPGGFTFNQFLVRDEQPFLFHTGMRQLYPLVSRGGLASSIAARRPALDLVRPRRGRRVRGDEPVPRRRPAGRGRPRRARVHGVAQRPRRPSAARRSATSALDLGTHRLRFLPTPHVPHNWESGLWFDETTTHVVRRRPLHARRRRTGVDRRRRRRAGARRRGDLPQHVVRPRPGRRRWSASPTSSRRRSR